MLSARLRARLLTYHSLLLAHLDRMEDALPVRGDLTDLDLRLEPEVQRVILDTLEFLERWEAQHELEEERLLIPLLQELETKENETLREVLEEVHRQHVLGGELLKEFRGMCSWCKAGPSQEGINVKPALVEAAHRLIDHYRGHAALENERLLSLLEDA